MDRVKEKQTAWIATFSEFFGSGIKKDETYEYSIWEQEYRTELEVTEKRLKKLIKETTSLKGRNNKDVVEKVDTENTTTITTGEVQYTDYINENEIEQ